MSNIGQLRSKLLICCTMAGLVSAFAVPSIARAQDSASPAQRNRIDVLEQRLSKLEARPAPAAPSSAIAQASQQMPPMGQQTGAQEGAPGAQASPPKTEQERIEELEKRVGDLESSTVFSEPETRVKRVEVWVDKNGIQYDHQVPGAKRVFTYERERVYRRQTINEKIEEAISSEQEKNVQVGVDAAIAPQATLQVEGEPTKADGHVYQLASADLFFTARIAQYTLFFADVVGLTGPPPDSEIPALTLINGYTARLVRQNELNLREAWVRTELFSQRVALNAGRLDLTNYFDRNAAANDETSQFLSDALVNNPVLGLATNGAGVALVYDPKRIVNFKIGFQQSNTDATNLSDSLFSMAEVGFIAKPFALSEGNYRVWYRLDNSAQRDRTAVGVSLDQKLAPIVTLFGRYGSAQADDGRDHFYSGGFQFHTGLVVNPSDTWGIGYGQLQLASGIKEKLGEAYYNFGLTERLRLSFHLQYVKQWEVGTQPVGYVVPGLRLQASF